jgi:V/A-type H+-transporting ATPase subunit B
MSWLDVAVPVRMKRVALVAANESLRDMLVRVADAAAVEIGPAGGDAVTSGPAGDQPATGGGAVLGGKAGRRLQRAGHPVVAAVLAASRPDLDALEQVLEGTGGMRPTATRVAFSGSPLRIPVGTGWLGQVCNGRGEPIDGGPPVTGEVSMPAAGFPD